MINILWAQTKTLHWWTKRDELNWTYLNRRNIFPIYVPAITCPAQLWHNLVWVTSGHSSHRFVMTGSKEHWPLAEPNEIYVSHQSPIYTAPSVSRQPPAKIIICHSAFIRGSKDCGPVSVPLLGRNGLRYRRRKTKIYCVQSFGAIRHNQILTCKPYVALVVQLSPHKRGKALIKVLTPLHAAYFFPPK